MTMQEKGVLRSFGTVNTFFHQTLCNDILLVPLKNQRMKLTSFSIIWAVIYLVFGLGLLLIPMQFMSSFGVTLDASGIMIARVSGAALTAFALTFWMNRNLSQSEKGWRNLLMTSFIYNIIDIPIVLFATFNGVMNSLGWMPVGLHIFLAATLGYFAFSKK